jgi:hypothetical protein
MKPAGPGHKKLLIYAGAAGAVIALLVLLKRKQSAPAEEGVAGAQYASAPSGIPAVGETTGNQSSVLKNELTEFENGLRTQLLEQRQAQPTSGGLNLQEVAGLLGVLRGTGAAGEQNGSGGNGSPSNPTPAPVEAPHPVQPPAPPPAPPAPPPPAPPAPPPPPPRPPAPPPWKDITCGNGCPGHRYPDGRVACMVKRSGRCVWP